jgi:hypothetical protein
MKIKDLSLRAKEIWSKEEKLPLAQIVVRLGKVFGDVCRWERNSLKDQALHNDNKLKKALGNLIFSTIKFCDELGYDPEDCIEN